MEDYFSGNFQCALHVKCSEFQAHVVLARLEEEDVRTVVLGSVVVASGWEEDVALPLAGWHSCVLSVKGPEKLVVEELSAGKCNSIVQGSPVVDTRVELDWHQNLIWDISDNNLYDVEAYSVVEFLRLNWSQLSRPEWWRLSFD